MSWRPIVALALTGFLLAGSASAEAPYPQPTAQCAHGTYAAVAKWNAEKGWKAVHLNKTQALEVATATGADESVLASIKSGEWTLYVAKNKTQDFVVIVVRDNKGCYQGAFPAQPDAVAKALSGQPS